MANRTVVQYSAKALRDELDIVLGDAPLPEGVTLHDVINTMIINLDIVRENLTLIPPQ